MPPNLPQAARPAGHARPVPPGDSTRSRPPVPTSGLPAGGGGAGEKALDGYYDWGAYTRAVSTRSAEAQSWFDRGLAWAYGFNREEAARCFRKAAAADPGCAMAHWGVAYAVGPYYNRQWHQFDAVELRRTLDETHAAARRALALREGATGVERTLVEAMARRCPSDRPPADFTAWTDDYAAAMRDAHRAYPDDPDVSALFADALLCRTPWKLWDLKSGEPRPGASTLEARGVLERAMAERKRRGRPGHAGQLHFYIHLMEMSPTPEAALGAGDALSELAAGCGHLHHMPTHIDFQCGRYGEVVARNSQAILADRKFLEREGPLNMFSYSRIHNIHFKLYGAMFLGHYRSAMEAVDEFADTVPEALIRIESPPMADLMEGYYGLKPHALIRFGRWREILDEPLPSDPALYLATTAVARYARTAAYAALGDVTGAEREKDLFDAAVARVPPTRMLFNNVWPDVLAVASGMLRGEIEYRKGRHDLAFAHLRDAVALEDGLPYDEPWGWMQPVRHALGALLLEQGRTAEAEAVYREDLGLAEYVIRARRHPDNVWSLHGLHECLRRRNAAAEAERIEPRLARALARADVPIGSSCFCRRGKGAS